MATHEVERKILSRLARIAGTRAEYGGFNNLELAAALYQTLGLSKMLSRRLNRARVLRRLEPTDEKMMNLYHHIIWMSREGLKIVEDTITRYAETNAYGAELKVFAYKLRASFYHVFCLFHNKPSVSPMNPAGDPYSDEQVPTVLLPIAGNRQARTGNTPPSGGKMKQNQDDPSPPSRVPTGIRDSMLSDTSNITNPFGSISALSPPPGLPPRQAPDPAAFLLPSTNFVPLTITSFQQAADLAARELSGSSPLRLSIALEYSAFKWDCLHDHPASRLLAKRTIQGVYEAQEGMDDGDFHDAAMLVGTLAKMRHRKSEERTPRFTAESPEVIPTTTDTVIPPPVPTVSQISNRQERALRQEARYEERLARQEVETQTSRPTPPRAIRPPPIMKAPAPHADTAVTSATELLSAEPRPTTSRGLNKSLPELPRQDPSFNIPRRPVGTPPSVRSRSRSQSEEEVTPTQSRVQTAAASRTAVQGNPTTNAVQDAAQTAARRSPREEVRAGKRKIEGSGDEGRNDSPRGGRSLIPRLRVRNP